MKLAIALFFTLTAFAQNRIAGTVLEQGTNTPLAGAQVALYQFSGTEDTGDGKLVDSAITGVRGEFSFQPTSLGSFRIEVKKSGYLSASEQTEIASRTVALRQERLQAEGISIMLMSPGSLTGRLIDEDRKPIADQRVLIQGSAPYFRTTASTDPDGVFIARSVPPGPYIVGIAPAAVGSLKVLAYTENDFKLVDQDVESSFWPGAMPNLKAVIPIPVLPGSPADLGTITVRKVSYYRAQVEFKGECSPGEEWRVAVLKLPYDNILPEDNRSATTPCAGHFLIRDLAPGSYMLAVWTGKEKIRWARTPLLITSENVKASIQFSPSANLTARVITPPGVSKVSLSSLRIEIRAEDAPPAGVPTMFTQDSDGHYSFGNVPWPRHSLRVLNLPNTHYIKEIHFAGQPVTDQFLDIVPSGQLDIVLDDHPATLRGTVKRDAGRELLPVQILVLLDREPHRGRSMQNEPFSFMSAASPTGAFQFLGLAPGTYRVKAFSAEGLSYLVNLNDISAAGGDLVSIGTGEAKTIELKLP